MIKIRQRHFFSLIEAVLALGLTALLMTTLSYFYLQLDQITHVTEKSLQHLYQLAYVESRLGTVLPKSVAENTAKKDFIFFSTTGGNGSSLEEGVSLFFTYDNGVDLNKKFSNHVLGRLFVDAENHLVLATWPSISRWKKGTLPPVKKEILLERVESLQLSFFIPPDVERSKLGNTHEEVKEKQIFTPTPPGTWTSEWPLQYYQLPSIVRIEIIQHATTDKQSETHKVVFEFPLPNSPRAIFYIK